MRRGLATTFLTMALAATLASPAAASPGDAGTCTDCHMIEPNVVVSTTFTGCIGTSAFYQGAVSNPYGIAGYGLFSGAAKLRSGYGTMASFSVAPNASYSFQGVSVTSGALGGGANSVDFTSPNCQCLDGDGDSYSPQPGCGAMDCNDGNAGIHPGAAEIWYDGIDQDCNGRDLTIEITSAQWSQSKKKLTVVATSFYGSGAALQLSGYGAMTWKNSKWSKVVTISANPGTVTVTGPEGSWSASVTTVR